MFSLMVEEKFWRCAIASANAPLKRKKPHNTQEFKYTCNKWFYTSLGQNAARKQDLPAKKFN